MKEARRRGPRPHRIRPTEGLPFGDFCGSRHSVVAAAAIDLWLTSCYMAEPPVEQHETALAIVWRRQLWRCEYWKSPATPGSLRLFREETLAMERRVQDVDEMLSVASTWKALIEDEFTPTGGQPGTARDMVRNRRRLPAERRAVPRGGRRREDPGR
jgi:hypothetical protein